MSTTATTEATTLASMLVRTQSVSVLRTAVAAEAKKIAKRVPGIEVTLVASPYTPGEPVTFCLVHRDIDCTSGPTYSEPWHANCYKVATEASRVELQVTGLPMVDGEWFVGGILTTDANGVTVATSIGNDVDGWASGLIHLAGQCVHCSKSRSRTVTVLLRTEAGDVRPVGRSCLGEYTGGALRAELLATLTKLGERFANELVAPQRADGQSLPLTAVVALAARYIALYGYVSAAKATKQVRSTRQSVYDALTFGSNKVSATTATATIGGTTIVNRPEITLSDLTDADTEAARAHIAETTTFDDGSDFAANLRAVCAADECEIDGKRSRLGLAVYIPAAAKRSAELKARRAQWAAEKAERDAGRVNDWIGEIKDRLEFTGTITKIGTVEHEVYGVSDLVVFDTAEGTVKILGTARGIENYSEGDRITVIGTIVRHEEYRENRTTRISRVKIAPKG